MDGVDLAILGVIGFLAVSLLAGMMVRRRDRFVEQFRREIAAEKQRLKIEKRKQSKKEKAA